MSDPKMLKLRGKNCNNRYLSDTQGRCSHPEKRYVECVTALRRGKCPKNCHDVQYGSGVPGYINRYFERSYNIIIPYNARVVFGNSSRSEVVL